MKLKNITPVIIGFDSFPTKALQIAVRQLYQEQRQKSHSRKNIDSNYLFITPH